MLQVFVQLMPRLHNGFDDQERNLTFVKTDFQVLKLKFHAYKNTFIQAFCSVPGCQTCMYKRGIRHESKAKTTIYVTLGKMGENQSVLLSDAIPSEDYLV